MNRYTQNTPTLTERLYDWVLGNKKIVAAAAGALVLLILITVLCCAPKVIDKGTDDQHGITWTFRSNGTLEFKGEGDIVGAQTEYVSGADALSESYPDWYEYRDQVTVIELGKKVRYVGMDSFVGFPALEELTVHGSNTELDIDCIRSETAAQRERFLSLIVWGKEGSSADIYAEFNGLEFRPL